MKYKKPNLAKIIFESINVFISIFLVSIKILFIGLVSGLTGMSLEPIIYHFNSC